MFSDSKIDIMETFAIAHFKRFLPGNLFFCRNKANDFACCYPPYNVHYNYYIRKNEENVLNTTECTLCAKIEETRKLSIQHINQHNSDIVQNNADLVELERRYNRLHIPHVTRRIIDDYIACILSRQERMESLIYYAGRNDVLN